MTEEDKIAVFKYGLLAPVINNHTINQTRYFKKIARIAYEYPGKIDKVQFRHRTFKKWLHLYRKYGAVLGYGVPQKFYCDNGKVFHSGYLHMICAKLGVALIHSKPYDSPSRGKIERFFRTVRDMFLPGISYDGELTLERLNEQFGRWLREQYSLNVHRGINDTPMDRYLADVPNVKIRVISFLEAEHYFYHTVYRLVKNDATISFNNELYEVPAKYIGKKIEIRFPLECPQDLKLFENEKQVALLKKLDKHFNSEMKIRYSKKEDQDV